MELSEKQIARIKKLAKIVDSGNLGIFEYLKELEDKLDNEIPKLKGVLEKIKGEDGHTPTDNELISLITPLIPSVSNGKDYVLTSQDKEEIARTIRVPIVEKIIEKIVEKTEVIKEQPIITQVVKEVALYETAEDTRNKLEALYGDDRLKIDAILNLREELDKAIKTNTEHLVSTSNRGLYQLLDVNVSGVLVGQSIKWDGIQWIPYTPSSGGGGLTNPVDYIQFNTSATPITNAEGLVQWNATDGTLDLGMSSGDIKLQIGQEMFLKVRNATGSTIPNGSPVYFSGSLGNRPKISLSISDTELTGNFAGLTTQDITNNTDGFITSFGYVRQIKTNYSGAGIWGTTWVEGDRLFVSKTNAGVLTNIEPSAPHHSDIIGSVGVIGPVGTGSILVSTTKHQTLEGLSDVNGTALTTTGQIPVWDNSGLDFDFNYNINNYWENDGTSSATGDWDIGSFNFTSGGLTGSTWSISPSGFGFGGAGINTDGSFSFDGGQITSDGSGNVSGSGTMTASAFIGDGSGLTNLSSSGIRIGLATALAAGFTSI